MTPGKITIVHPLYHTIKFGIYACFPSAMPVVVVHDPCSALYRLIISKGKTTVLLTLSSYCLPFSQIIPIVLKWCCYAVHASFSESDTFPI